LGLIVLGAIFYWLVVIVIMHFVEPEFDPLKVPMSAYVAGAYGGWMTTSFFALATALVAAVLGVFGTARDGGFTSVGSFLLVAAACGVVLAGIFPGIIATASSVHWHTVGSRLAFPGMTLGSFLLSVGFRFNPNWRRISAASLTLASGMLIVQLLWFVGVVPGFAGLMQRLFFALFVPWIVLVGLHLVRVGREEDSQPAA
jgi:hypothetical protein